MLIDFLASSLTRSYARERLDRFFCICTCGPHIPSYLGIPGCHKVGTSISSHPSSLHDFSHSRQVSDAVLSSPDLDCDYFNSLRMASVTSADSEFSPRPDKRPASPAQSPQPKRARPTKLSLDNSPWGAEALPQALESTRLSSQAVREFNYLQYLRCLRTHSVTVQTTAGLPCQHSLRS